MATPRIYIDTAANWKRLNPTLAAGETYYEIEPGGDIGKSKIGTGAAWNSTAYNFSGVINAEDAAGNARTIPSLLAIYLSQNPDIQTELTDKQPLDADLTAIAALTPANDDFLQRKAGAWTNRTPAQVLADLGLGDAVVYKGVMDCSSDPDYPAANAGDLYIVSVAGKIGGAGGVSVETGDWFICKVDGSLTGNQAAVGANWNVIQGNLINALMKATGAGTENKLIKFNASGEAADSSIEDDGTYVNINKAEQTDATMFVKSSADDKPAIVAEAHSTLGGQVVKVRAEDENLVIENSTGSQRCGTISRNTSDAGMKVVADAASLLLGTGGSGTTVDVKPKNVPAAQYDDSGAAGETRMLLYDVDSETLVRVSVGAADSGGAGFKVLRIPN